MREIVTRRSFKIVVFLFFDVLSIAMGMGVPIFTILYGFLVGLVIPGFLNFTSSLSRPALKQLIRAGLITSGVSFVVLAILWLPSLQWLFDPDRDLANFGIPMILFTPRASFIGWIVLMVIISPFLQFLMTLFGAIARVAFSKK